MKKLQVALIEDVGEEDYKNLFDLSIRLSDYITEQFKDKETGETPDEFWWHRSCATRPAFHHLCFAYKVTVYSCLIGSIIVPEDLYSCTRLEQQPKRNKGIWATVMYYSF